jgi:CDP-glycerol glycerophosphotransferase (TagB/SpsB family)
MMDRLLQKYKLFMSSILKSAINISKKFFPAYIIKTFNYQRRLAFKVFVLRIAILVFLRMGRRRVWVFTAWCGRVAGDNPLHFSLYLTKSKTNIVPVWILEGSKSVAMLKRHRLQGYIRDSAFAKAWLSLAEVCFYSDMPCFGDGLPRNALKVNLWHGMPIKSLGKMNTDSDIVVCTAPEFQEILSKVFDLNREFVAVLGQPKNDALFSVISRPPQLKQWVGARIITYMPTYRGSFHSIQEKERANLSGILMERCLWGNYQKRLEEILEANNAILVIKPHLRNIVPPILLQRVLVIDEYEAGEVALDSHQLLSITDILITDYCSILFDFLLLNKPYIIFAPDYEEYKISQKLYFDLRELSSGNFVETEMHLLDCLEKILKNPNQPNEMRSRLRDRFNAFTDGGSCSRIFEMVERKMQMLN